MKKRAPKEPEADIREEEELTEEVEPQDELEYDPVDHLAQLEQERDEALEKYRRALADFQNFQRRALQNEQQAREQGIAGVVHSLLPALDHFQLALDQDLSQTTVEQFAQGMGIVRDELGKALRLHNLSRLEVKVGDLFDPTLHEAVAHVPGEGIEPGHISNITQHGYKLGERVLRATKVTVAPGTADDDDQDEPDIVSEDQD